MKSVLVLWVSLMSVSAMAKNGESVICLGYHPAIGNTKIEASATSVKVYKSTGAEFVFVKEATVVKGQSMLGGTHLTSFVKDAKRGELIDLQLTIQPKIEGGAFLPISFYDAPYYHAELLYLTKGNEVTEGQLYNDPKVIAAPTFMTCKLD